MSSIPHNSNLPAAITTENARQQSGIGQSFRMPLQLPENKRLKLQQHERNKLHQQQQQSPQVMDPSGQQQLHSPVPPISGGFAQQQQHHQHSQQPQTQQPQSQQYYPNPTYQQASVSRPAFEHASSSYQVHHGAAQPQPTPQHGHIPGHPQGSAYQYVQVQQPSQQYQTASSSGSNNMMPQNYMAPSAGPSTSSGTGNNNFQMYNLSGLPASARPPTSSGQQVGMMNVQGGSAGPLSAQGQPMVVQVDDSMPDASGSRRIDSGGYNEFGVQGPHSANTSSMNHKPTSVTSVPGSSKTSGSGMPAPADMPAFSGGSFAMGSSSVAGGASSLSGYQVGMPPINGIAQSVGQIGQQVQSQMSHDVGNQGQGPFGGASGQGQGSGTVDQEIFEFMKRKRWPQLLMQELVGAVVWCLIPYERRLSMVGDCDMDADDDGMYVPGASTGKEKRRPSIKDELIRKPSSGWKVVFASPAIHELLGVKPEEAEGRDWADFIHPRDLARLLNLMSTAVENTASSSDPLKSGSSSGPETSAQGMSSFNYEVSQARSSAFEPVNMSVPQSTVGGFVGPGTSGTSLMDYVRMVDKMGQEVLFELKGHAHLGDEQGQEPPSSPEENGGFDGGGVMGVSSGMAQNRRRKSQRRSADDPAESRVKAFWIMGRKWCPRNDDGGRMLEHFLELKLENERLKQELKGLQSRPFGSKEPLAPRSQIYATASFQPSHVTHIGNFNAAGQPKERTASADNTDDSGADDDGSEDDTPGVLRQPPQHNRVSDLQGSTTGEESKKSKRQKNKNPEYLCRNCGRNDSPEWRKGPLGPKTLCNACGLRWAKKQAGPNSKRKDKEKDKEQAPRPMEGFHTMNVNTMDLT